MSQCVPSWDLDESNKSSRIPFQADPNTNSAAAPEDAMLDYEVAELTWENGQLSMHGLGLPRPAVKPLTTSGKCPWDKPRAGGTLESIVDQATCLPPPKGDELVPWFAHHSAAPAAAAMDALVPCSKRRSSGQESSTRVRDPDPDPSREGFSKRVVGSSTRVGSCSVAAKEETAAAAASRKRMKVAGEGSSREQSASRHVTMDTNDMDLDAGFTSSLGSHDHTSHGQPLSSHTKPTTVDDHDSVCHSSPQREAGSGDEKNGRMGRSSISTKRSRAAAIHNQSERKRRDRINQRMKTLQKLVPNSSKTDKASMLDEVIEYLKQLQAQIQMMSKMSSIPHMMMPMAMQQLQMSMMAQMGMGMGMGMGVMDLSSINRTGHATAPVPPMLHPAAFLPLTAAAWDGSGDRLQPVPGVMSDPFSTAFLACQTQPMNLDAYNRMAALYQQLQQSSGLIPPNSKT